MNRRRPMRTEDIGNSVRGNAVLRMSRPPLTTDFDASVSVELKKLKANRHAMRWAK